MPKSINAKHKEKTFEKLQLNYSILTQIYNQTQQYDF